MHSPNIILSFKYFFQIFNMSIYQHHGNSTLYIHITFQYNQKEGVQFPFAPLGWQLVHCKREKLCCCNCFGQTRLNYPILILKFDILFRKWNTFARTPQLCNQVDNQLQPNHVLSRGWNNKTGKQLLIGCRSVWPRPLPVHFLILTVKKQSDSSPFQTGPQAERFFCKTNKCSYIVTIL